MSITPLNPLGRNSIYPDSYNAKLLFPIARADGRQQLSIQEWHGVDIWTGYELSWLNEEGIPQVAIAEFSIPATSPNLIESKSFKLYLNSLNAHRFEDAHALMTQVTADLSACAGAIVSMRLYAVDQLEIGYLPGECLDSMTPQVSEYHYNPQLLIASQYAGHACWHSHLLKSNCPVTGQPDWGSIVIDIQAEHLPTAESLLAYLVSFRNHQGFHEQCVEQIYHDLTQLCHPTALTVYARYVRRGGLDINPWRSHQAHHAVWVDMPRLARQ
jgi:7-cyano-7-deazaguanine reductase